jgi:cell division protein FtsI (penicillin-binding protein 3)
LAQWRSSLLLALLLAGFAGLATRSLYLQVLNNEFLREKGDRRYSRVIEINPHRGMITDRQGEPLAISTPVESVWASPADARVSASQLKQLSGLLKIDSGELRKRLHETQREFVYLKRQIPPDLATQVVQIGAPGIFLQREYRRYYPAGEVLSHVLGFTGVDDDGREGVELAYDDWLAGKAGSRRVIKDRVGRIVEDVESIKTPQPGRDLVLSIDRRIQYLAYRELKSAVELHRAKAGAIVVLDAKSGELLAMANWPAFNPNNRNSLSTFRVRNRAVIDIFEPGSTLKPFTVAAALEAGKCEPDTLIQTGTGKLTIGVATIHDVRPEGTMTVSEIIQKSSNVGAAKIALSLPSQYLWTVYDKLGFGSPPHIGFPGEAPGKLRPYKTWQPIEQATMAFGHGISVSLLQLARAYTVFANDGELKPLSLLKLDTPSPGRRVFSPDAARAVRSMLELVVQPGGTAPQARVVGYRVAGKTGTAHKLEGNTYAADHYISSFVGLAPASNPQLIIAVMIDDPGGDAYYGGAVAAPVFSRVAAGALRLMGILPDAPVDSMDLPEDAPEVGEMV